MFMSVLMLIAWQSTLNPIYLNALNSSSIAYYETSDIRSYVEGISEKVPNTIASLGYVGYSLGMQHRLQYKHNNIGINANVSNIDYNATYTLHW